MSEVKFISEVTCKLSVKYTYDSVKAGKAIDADEITLQAPNFRNRNQALELEAMSVDAQKGANKEMADLAGAMSLETIAKIQAAAQAQESDEEEDEDIKDRGRKLYTAIMGNEKYAKRLDTIFEELLTKGGAFFGEVPINSDMYRKFNLVDL